MKKAIIVGNGFTSQIIPDYQDDNMKQKMFQLFNDEYIKINKLFDIFRMSELDTKRIYSFGGGTILKDDTILTVDLFLQDNRVLYNTIIREHVIEVLTNLGFVDAINVFENYFINYGLIFEINRSSINSIENILKVISLFKIVNRTDSVLEESIKNHASVLYYNKGKYGFSDSTQRYNKKIIEYFISFDFVFTTNYDLILDDICKDNGKVFHLHGGFNFLHRNLKTDKRLSFDEAYLVWGISGDEKYKELKPGWDYGDFRYDAVRFDRSLLADYFETLEKGEYDEIHVFGFSGENDQHINKRISTNRNCCRIYYYCKPENVNDYNYKGWIEELFINSRMKIILKPWTDIWSDILEETL